MRYLRLLTLLFLCLLALSQSAWLPPQMIGGGAPAAGGANWAELDVPAGNGGLNCNPTSSSGTFTISSGADLLVCMIGSASNTNTIDTVSVGGESLAELREEHGAGDNASMAIYYKVLPTAGASRTVSITLSGNNQCGFICATYTGSNTGDPFRTTYGEHDTSSPCTNAVVDNASGEILTQGVVKNTNAAMTSGGAATERLEVSQTGLGLVFQTAAGTGSSVSMSSSWSGGAYNACAAVSLKNP